MAALSRLGRSRDHPRLRGEYFHSSQALRANGGSPPLARGIRFWFWDPKEETRITPACAGNTGYKKFCPQRAEDHPRLRGEYKTQIQFVKLELGSPPLARGIQKSKNHVCISSRITPACAGNTFFLHILSFSSKDHPRLRGEYTKKIPYLQPFPDLHL